MQYCNVKLLKTVGKYLPYTSQEGCWKSRVMRLLGQAWLSNSPIAGNAGFHITAGKPICATLLLGLYCKMKTMGHLSLVPVSNDFIVLLKWILEKRNGSIGHFMFTGCIPQSNACVVCLIKHSRKIHLNSFKIIISLSIVIIFQRCFINGNRCFGNRPLRVCGYLAVTGVKGL